MNNETLMLLAKFTFQARKLIGAIDSNLLANDETYRNSIFQKIDVQGDEELLMLSMVLRNKLNSPTVEEAKKTESNTASDKYKFGARG